MVFISRKARQKSQTDIYHAMVRGINKQTIFEDEEDKAKYLQIISECKAVSGFKILGYCLMGNHAHLLLKVEDEELEQIFKRIGTRYVYWFNKKYFRSGHLFQDRYKSEAVEDGNYFITVLRYIHQNPLKAHLCNYLEEYKWSSYNNYITKTGLTDVSLGTEIIGDKSFVEFMNEKNQDVCLEIEQENKRLTDDELISKIIGEFKLQPMAIQSESKDRRDILLKKILAFEGVSTRQVSRVTGVPVNIIWKL